MRPLRRLALPILFVACGDVKPVDELLPWYGAGDAVIGARGLRWTRSSGREPDAQMIAATWIEEGR